MSKIVYQQGDVILQKINTDDIDKYMSVMSSSEDDEKVVLALGEATGHHHRFETSKLNEGVLVHGYGRQWQKEPSFITINNGPATLYHEEHNPITVPKGAYAVKIVREFDHFGTTTRRVVD